MPSLRILSTILLTNSGTSAPFRHDLRVVPITRSTGSRTSWPKNARFGVIFMDSWTVARYAATTVCTSSDQFRWSQATAFARSELRQRCHLSSIPFSDAWYGEVLISSIRMWRHNSIKRRLSNSRPWSLEVLTGHPKRVKTLSKRVRTTMSAVCLRSGDAREYIVCLRLSCYRVTSFRCHVCTPHIVSFVF